MIDPALWESVKATEECICLYLYEHLIHDIKSKFRSTVPAKRKRNDAKEVDADASASEQYPNHSKQKSKTGSKLILESGQRRF